MAKKISNKKSLLTNFANMNKKSKYLAVIAITALVGGGIMVFRSFANPNITIFSPGNRNFTYNGGSMPTMDPAKNGAEIAYLPSNGKITTLNVATNKSGLVCINVRSDFEIPSNTVTVKEIAYKYLTSKDESSEFGITVTPKWTERCYLNKFSSTSTRFEVTNSSGKDVYVSFVRYIPPAPAPPSTSTLPK